MENVEQLKAIIKVYTNNALTNTLEYRGVSVLTELIELLTLRAQNRKSVYINIVNDETIHAEKIATRNTYTDKTIIYKYIYTITGASYSIIEALKRL